MQLITDDIQQQLVDNALADESEEKSLLKMKPVMKLFTPSANATWLIVSMPAPGMLFGLCDLGLGLAELGPVMLAELEALSGPYALGVERDLYFEPEYTLEDYMDAADISGYIVSSNAQMKSILPNR